MKAVLALFVVAEAKVNSTYTVNDQIKFDGNTVMEGSNIQTGCHIAPKGATSVTVCGAAVKVKVSLLSECQEYSKYTHEVGRCDNGDTSCLTSHLETGYTDKFKWEAQSYEVLNC